jgi:hypothetical protein
VTQTGFGYNTNPADVVWFCHLCSASFVLPAGTYHVCSPSPAKTVRSALKDLWANLRPLIIGWRRLA